MINQENVCLLSRRAEQQERMTQICTVVLVAMTFIAIVSGLGSIPAKFFQEFMQISPMQGLRILLTSGMSLGYALVALYLLQRGKLQSRAVAKFE